MPQAAQAAQAGLDTEVERYFLTVFCIGTQVPSSCGALDGIGV